MEISKSVLVRSRLAQEPDGLRRPAKVEHTVLKVMCTSTSPLTKFVNN